LVLEQARLSLADSATFRAICGETDRAGTLLHCHLRNLPAPAGGADAYSREELESLRPYGLIYLPQRGALSLRSDAMGSHREYAASGKLMLRISRLDATGMNRDEADADWDDAVMAVIDELAALSGDGAEQYLCFDSLLIADGPGRHHPDYDPAQGEEQGVDLEISWGGTGQ
jgi:hypothetical protein